MKMNMIIVCTSTKTFFAKYIHDLGCKDFKISQSQFYKNLFSRSYEYIAVAKI